MHFSLGRDSCFGGIVMLGIAALLAYFNLPYVTHGIHTEGVVVDVVEQMAMRRGRTYYPVVTFSDGNQMITFKSNVGTAIDQYEIGATVPIVYLPDQPEQAKLNTFSHMWLAPLATGSLGLLALLISLIAFLQTRIPSQQQLYRQAMYGWKPNQ